MVRLRGNAPMSMAETLSKLSGVTYLGAIAHYKAEKNRFFTQYALTAKITEQQAIDKFNNEIVDEINENPVEDQEKLANELFKNLRDGILEKMKESSSRGTLSNYKKESQEKFQKKVTQGQKELQKEAERLVSEKEMKDYIIKHLSNYGVSNTGFSVNDLLNQAIGYRNALVTSIINNEKRPQLKYYERPGKGYVREAMIHKCFYNLFSQLENVKDIEGGNTYTIATGNFAVDNKDTPMDQYISFLDDIKGSYLADAQYNLNLGYGVQSKPWVEPWKEVPNYLAFKYGYDVGHRAELLNQLTEEEKYHWTLGVQVIGETENTLIALGKQNIMFITGLNFYWTEDLIKNFRELNYFLAFVHRTQPDKAKKATAHIRWQFPHNDDEHSWDYFEK